MNKFKKILVFDITSSFAHFRKPYTNMCRLTYFTPPRTSISGLIGGIMGINRNANPENFKKENCLISVKILEMNEKVNIAQNYIKELDKIYLTNGISQRKPTVIEYIRTPKYRIYFSHKDDDLYNKLIYRLENKYYFYTPYLGISKCFARIDYIGDFDLQISRKKKNIKIDSVISSEFIERINSQNDKVYSEKIHNAMDNKRNVLEYKRFIFSNEDLYINCKRSCYTIKDINENIYEM